MTLAVNKKKIKRSSPPITNTTIFIFTKMVVVVTKYPYQFHSDFIVLNVPKYLLSITFKEKCVFLVVWNSFCPKWAKRKLSYSSFLCVLHCRLFFGCTSVFLLFRCFPLKVDVFPSVLVCNPDLFSLNRDILLLPLLMS